MALEQSKKNARSEGGYFCPWMQQHYTFLSICLMWHVWLMFPVKVWHASQMISSCLNTAGRMLYSHVHVCVTDWWSTMMGRGSFATLSTNQIFHFTRPTLLVGFTQDVLYNPWLTSGTFPQILPSHVMNYIVDDNGNFLIMHLKIEFKPRWR